MVGRDWRAGANAFRYTYVYFLNLFGISIDPDYRSGTNTLNPLKSLAVLIGADPAQPIAATTSMIAKKSLSGKKTSIPNCCICEFEASFCFGRVSIVMCSDDVAQATHWFDFQKMWPETAREMAIHFSSDPSILEGLTVTVADDKSKCGHKIRKFNRSGGGPWFGCNNCNGVHVFRYFLATRVI